MSHTNSQVRRLNLVSPFLYTGPGAGVDSSSGLFNAFGLQGIKGSDSLGSYLITGTSGSNGVVYDGPIDHAMTPAGSGSGTWTVMNVPSNFNAQSTSIYGVANLSGSTVNLVGSYVSNSPEPDGQLPRIGFFYTGAITSTPDATNFQSYRASDPSTGRPASFTYIHSVDGGLAVGNYDFLGDGRPAGNAFIYDPITGSQKAINYGTQGKTHTAYGIWHNGGDDYTIAGGEGLNGIPEGDGRYGEPLGRGALIDYDRVTGDFSNYRSYRFSSTKLLPKEMRREALVTHFEGIWSDGEGTYRLPATVTGESSGKTVAALATVKRNRDGSFGKARWSVLDVPGTILSTNDSVFGDAVVGLAAYAGAAGISDYAGLLL